MFDCFKLSTKYSSLIFLPEFILTNKNKIDLTSLLNTNQMQRWEPTYFNRKYSYFVCLSFELWLPPWFYACVIKNKKKRKVTIPNDISVTAARTHPAPEIGPARLHLGLEPDRCEKWGGGGVVELPCQAGLVWFGGRMWWVMNLGHKWIVIAEEEKLKCNILSTEIVRSNPD